MNPNPSHDMPGRDDITDLRQVAAAAVRGAEQRARDFYRINLPAAALDFSLRGRCAGQARFERSGSTALRLNLQLLADNRDDFLEQTIPHEVAHLVVNWLARKSRQKPRPHGPEWRAVMQDCFGLPPTRCHSYRTTAARTVPRPFLYRCTCREHRLTSIMHNRIRQSARALCKACKTSLTFVAAQEP